MSAYREIRRVRRSDFFRNVFLLMSATAAGQFVTVASIPILSRLYEPETFGVLAVFIAITGSCSVLSTLKYDLAIVLAKEDAEAASVFSLTCLVALTVSLLTIPVIFYAPANLGLEANGLSESLVLIGIPAFVLLRGTTTALNSWMIRRKKFKTIALTELLRAFSTAVVQILGGLAELAANGMIFGRLLGRLLSAIFLWYYMIRMDGTLLLESIKKDKISIVAKKYINFPKYSSPRALLNEFSRHGMPLFLAFFFDPAAAGFFWLSFRLLEMPMRLVGEAVRNVFYQKAVEIHGEKKILMKISRRTTLFLGIIALGPTVIILLAGPSLFGFFFGTVWYKAGLFSQWLIISWFSRFVIVPSNMLVPILNLQRLAFKVDTMKLVLQCAAVPIAAFYGSDALAVAAYSIVAFLTNTFIIYYVFMKIRQYDERLFENSVSKS